MEYLKNDYAIPVIYGHGKNISKALSAISTHYSGKPHIFAKNISPVNRLRCNYHKLTSTDEEILMLALFDFADSYSESYTHVYVAYDAYTLDFYQKNSIRLESRYVLANIVKT